MMTHSAFPPDIRIELELRTLTSQGARAMVMAPISTISHTEKAIAEQTRCEYFRGFSVFGFPLANVGDLVRGALSFSPDIIHIHDSPIFLYGLLVGLALRKPIVFDNHEIWPNLVEATTRTPAMKAVAKLLYWFVEFIAAHASRKVIVVVEEAAWQVMKSYRVARDKVGIIHNYASICDLEQVETSSDPRLKSRFAVAYVGGLQEMRGLQVVKGALGRLDDLEDLLLILVGKNGEANFSDPRVLVLGWLDFVRAQSYVCASEVCLLLHRKCALTDHGLPHKITQYLFFGKPVVCTPLNPIMRLFGGAVMVIRDGDDGSDLARALRTLYFDKILRSNLGRKGQELVMGRLNWENEGPKLVQMYREIGTVSSHDTRPSN